MRFFRKISLYLLIGAACYGCHTAAYQPMAEQKARIGEMTTTGLELRSLPEPRDPLVVAVYSFRDQTGQYKPTEGGSSFSTAVTQGATNILVKALEDSKWFLPIERENISDLLNERKIIRSSRQQHGNNDDLPALLFAGMLIEGGIVSYDANVVTGGAGLRYFGAGAASQYRQDRVTVYLRAVSVSNGKILKTVYTSRTVLSQQMEAGLFRYVTFRRILEAETGYSYNEPSEIAVREAIEKAVQSLIMEGIEDGLWTVRHPDDLNHPQIAEYKRERDSLPAVDPAGRNLDRYQRKWALHGALPQLRYQGDYGSPRITTGFEAGLLYQRSPYISLGGQIGTGRLATDLGLNVRTSYLDLVAMYRPMPFQRVTPVMFGGYGWITPQTTLLDFGQPKYGQMSLGGGFEWRFKKEIALLASVSHHWVMSDAIDNAVNGKYNDTYYKGQIGLRYSFGQKLALHPRAQFLEDQKNKEKTKSANDF